MELGNYKIKVTTEAESKEVCALLEQLGISEGDFNGFHVPCIIATLGNKYSDYAANTLNSRKPRQELSIPQLRDLVVLHRNDVSDATHTDQDNWQWFISSSGIGYVFGCGNSQNLPRWDESSLDMVDLIPIEKQIIKAPEQGLISGADALRALADGKEVEYFNNDWIGCDSRELVVAWYLDDVYQFRLKPRTITLKIEIPAPFEPKVGDEVFYLDGSCKYGYNSYIYDGFKTENPLWKGEEEVKQVVAAFSGALKNG